MIFKKIELLACVLDTHAGSETMNNTLKPSGRTSAMTIQIIHPAAKPVQKGRNLLNASAQMKEGTATMGCREKRYKPKTGEKTQALRGIKNTNIAVESHTFN